MSTQHWFRRMVVLVPTFTPKPPSEEAKSAAQVQMAAVNCRPGRPKFDCFVRLRNMDYAQYRVRAYPRIWRR